MHPTEQNLAILSILMFNYQAIFPGSVVTIWIILYICNRIFNQWHSRLIHVIPFLATDDNSHARIVRSKGKTFFSC
jgi:hypothetical protein